VGGEGGSASQVRDPLPEQGVEFVEDAVEVEQVERSDAFHLPIDQVELSIALLVARRAHQVEMCRMDVDLHSPSHSWHRQVEANLPPIRQLQVGDLWLHRDSAAEQPVQHSQLGIRLGR
jgi:hypothetical protein